MICPRCMHSDECDTYKYEKFKEENNIISIDRGIFFGCDGFEERKEIKNET